MAKSPANRPSTVGDLKSSGYHPAHIKEEIRRNLISIIEKGDRLFPGIVGFEDTVIPQLENAILAGQDIVLLGERGQAKSRILRQLVTLLDAEIPVIAGCEVNDNPFSPICRRCKDLVSDKGDGAPVSWLPRDRRYGEKLATPDISVADLIGEIDPIRVAEGRYLADELTIHFGLVPRTNRGIFCINELPDLAERIQVSLFNLMEERDIQIKGYRIVLPLDVMLVASANPEDYTNRGRIITPLKDRYGAQIRTHYPKLPEHEIAIIEQEHSRFADTRDRVIVPQYMKEVIAEITRLARKSPEINQRSGVSLRVSIANYETLLGSAFKRSLRRREVASPRVSDLPGILASTTGKIELETTEEGKEGRVVEDLIKKAVVNVFNRHVGTADLSGLVTRFDSGLIVETGADIPSARYVEKLRGVDDISKVVQKLVPSEEPATFASAVELILEGMHLNRKLNREMVSGRYQYRR
ncbi:MAG: magnesium chelatase [SAR202 cluster bacterium]|nr:magnesium chelatase [SAR202 cluster bacterium]